APPPASVEDPAGTPDRVAGGQHRRADGAAVVGDIENHDGAPRPFDAPDVAPWLEQRRAVTDSGGMHDGCRASDMPVACRTGRSDLRSLLPRQAWNLAACPKSLAAPAATRSPRPSPAPPQSSRPNGSTTTGT